MAKALKIDARDNCAVLLADVRKGEPVEVRTDAGLVSLSARCAIAFGHKIALASLTVDQPIIKYGEEIGRARVGDSRGRLDPPAQRHLPPRP